MYEFVLQNQKIEKADSNILVSYRALYAMVSS